MSLSVKGQESTFDLRELSLGDACRLGSWVRDLETVGKSSEEVCQLIAMSLARSFCSQESRQSQLSLVEVFHTRNLGDLPARYQDRWVSSVDGDHAPAQTRVLALMGVAGDSAEWTIDRPPFGLHCVPIQAEFSSQETAWYTRLWEDLGLSSPVNNFEKSLTVANSHNQLFGILVHEIPRSYNLAESRADFLRRHGVKQVICLGGLLPSGGSYCVFLYSRVTVDSRIRSLLQVLSGNICLACSTGDEQYWSAKAKSGEGKPYSREVGFAFAEETYRRLLKLNESLVVDQEKKYFEDVQELHQTDLKMRRIADAVPGAVYQYVITRDGCQRFSYISRGAMDMVGYPSDVIVSDYSAVWKLVLPEDMPGIMASIENAIRSGSRWAHEFRLRLPDGRVKWLRGDSLPERPTVDGTVLFHGLLTDVTERRLAEAKLRFTQFATDHAADAILWAGPDRRIMYVNVRATELLGYSREELLNLSMPDIAPLQSRIDILNDLTRLKQGEVVQYATTFRRKSGTVFPIEVSMRYLEHDGEGYVCAIVRDVSERKRAESVIQEGAEALRRSQEALRALHSQLLTAQEDERRRVARELHDDLGSRLGSVILRAEGKLVLLENKSPEAAVIKNVTDELRGISDRVRTIAHELHPSILDNLGLSVALKKMLKEYGSWSGMKIVSNISMEFTEALDREVATCLYRIAQEALMNVKKHAGAQQVMVSLAREEGWVQLSVKDDGMGFSPETESRRTKGLGIVAMEERIHMVAGELAVQSGKGRGAVVVARAPYREREA